MIDKSDFPFCYTHRVRFNEVDGQGIVFNGHYLTFFDHALTEYLRACGVVHTPGAPTLEKDKDFNVVKSVVEYKAPAFFDDLIDIYVRIQRIGRSSLVWELAVVRQMEDSLVAQGELIWVYSDQVARESESIPENIRGMLLSISALSIDDRKDE